MYRVLQRLRSANHSLQLHLSDVKELLEDYDRIDNFIRTEIFDRDGQRIDLAKIKELEAEIKRLRTGLAAIIKTVPPPYPNFSESVVVALSPFQLVAHVENLLKPPN